MSDDDKKGPGTSPGPDELQRSLQEFFGKMGNAQWVMPGMGQEPEETTPEPGEERSADSVFEFNYIPRDIKAHLDRFVIRQDEAKKAAETKKEVERQEAETKKRKAEWDIGRRKKWVRGPMQGREYRVEDVGACFNSGRVA